MGGLRGKSWRPHGFMLWQGSKKACRPDPWGPVQVPEFRVSYTITTDKLDAMYRRLKPKGVTMSALLAKASGVALAKHPIMFAGGPQGAPYSCS